MKNGPAKFSRSVLFDQHICSCSLDNQERWDENRIGQKRHKSGFTTKAIFKCMLTCAAVGTGTCRVPIPVSEGSTGVGKAWKVCDRTMVACGFAQKIWSVEKAVVLAISVIISKGSLSCYVAQRSFRRTHSSRCWIHFACLENNVHFCVFLPLLDTKVNLRDGFSNRSAHGADLGAVGVLGLRSCRFFRSIPTKRSPTSRARHKGMCPFARPCRSLHAHCVSQYVSEALNLC